MLIKNSLAFAHSVDARREGEKTNITIIHWPSLYEYSRLGGSRSDFTAFFSFHESAQSFPSFFKVVLSVLFCFVSEIALFLWDLLAPRQHRVQI